mmetsp:Transcript_9814/g.14876  ORF Transcript_9814/g.14876 Transcript_9814/m.14876 type:complete len:94 (+) Transcript_9814:42-323(+)
MTRPPHVSSNPQITIAKISNRQLDDICDELRNSDANEDILCRSNYQSAQSLNNPSNPTSHKELPNYGSSEDLALGKLQKMYSFYPTSSKHSIA